MADHERLEHTLQELGFERLPSDGLKIYLVELSDDSVSLTPFVASERLPSGPDVFDTLMGLDYPYFFSMRGDTIAVVSPASLWRKRGAADLSPYGFSSPL